MNALRTTVTLLAIALAQFAHAQQATESPGAVAHSGSVTGHVYDGGTRMPLRFALVRLIPKPPDADLINAQEQTQVPRLQVVPGSTGMDGGFHLDGVPAGDYLVAAIVPGYITPGTSPRLDATEDQLKAAIAALPPVHVREGQTETVNPTLHRGAVITGSVHFADGSPYTASVTWELAENILLMRPDLGSKPRSPRLDLLSFFEFYRDHPRSAPLDDEGRFRIFGVPPGKYVLSIMLGLDHSSSAVLSMEGGGGSRVGRGHAYPEMIPVYEPGVFRRKTARIFDIHDEERITDADMTIDPDGLHTIRGKVLAAGDRHAPTAMVQLREEGTQEVARFVEIEDDGSFQINYLPSATYAFEVEATDVATNASTRFYQAVRLTTLVGDHNVVLKEILMTPLKPGEKVDYSPF